MAYEGNEEESREWVLMPLRMYCCLGLVCCLLCDELSPVLTVR